MKNTKRKVLVIVAHPDDETIWMGGYLLRNKDKWDVMIISLCRKNDLDRAPKFFEACKRYNAGGFISDLDDSEGGEYKKISSAEIKKIIEGVVNGQYFDLIFTHGENGEYGHIRHIEINKAVKEMILDGSLKSREIFFFAYHMIEAKGTETGFDCLIDQNADKFINLNDSELLKKKELITMIYKYPKGGFEERACRDIESFNKII